MSSPQEILAAEFEALKADIIAQYEASGMMASGDWGRELEVRTTKHSATLLGPGYIFGRKPGTPPPSEAIEQWLKDKGIAARLETEISIGSLAFLIARKIGREGWQPKQQDIIESVATPERIRQILDRVGESHVADITRGIILYLKTATA